MNCEMIAAIKLINTSITSQITCSEPVMRTLRVLSGQLSGAQHHIANSSSRRESDPQNLPNLQPECLLFNQHLPIPSRPKPWPHLAPLCFQELRFQKHFPRK